MTRSATVAGLVALSGAMFGGCMPTVRPDMRAMGPYPGGAQTSAPAQPRSSDSGASTTDISNPTTEDQQ